jgi:hypothetical protein
VNDSSSDQENDGDKDSEGHGLWRRHIVSWELRQGLWRTLCILRSLL